MQLKNLFLSIPRSTWETLAKHHLVRQNILVWYDLIRFFDAIDSSPEAERRRKSKIFRSFTTMDKYIITAEHFKLSDDHVRRIIACLNRFI